MLGRHRAVAAQSRHPTLRRRFGCSVAVRKIAELAPWLGRSVLLREPADDLNHLRGLPAGSGRHATFPKLGHWRAIRFTNP